MSSVQSAVEKKNGKNQESKKRERSKNKMMMMKKNIVNELLENDKLRWNNE